MIYIYRRPLSKSAKALARAVGGKVIRSTNGVRLEEGDALVCWGEQARVEIPTLNCAPLRNKYEEALVLKRASIPTIEVSLERPDDAFWEPHFNSPLNRAGVSHLISELQTWLEQDSSLNYLPRRFHHAGGHDFSNPPARPDYFSKRENLVREFRVHSFQNRSLRAGEKLSVYPTSHPWVRSLQSGWKISYTPGRIRQEHRDLAHKAVSALGLQFGAVDLAEREDGSLMILEVNRAPGIEGGTLEKYVEAIRGWKDGL